MTPQNLEEGMTSNYYHQIKQNTERNVYAVCVLVSFFGLVETLFLVLSQFVINVAFCNKTVVFCNKIPVAFCNNCCIL